MDESFISVCGKIIKCQKHFIAQHKFKGQRIEQMGHTAGCFPCGQSHKFKTVAT